MTALLKIAYENIPATVSAVDASEIAWNLCHKPNAEAPSDVCFLTAYVVGSAAVDRDKGRSLDSLLREWDENKKATGTPLNLEALFKRPYEQKTKMPWELQRQQYAICKNLSLPAH